MGFTKDWQQYFYRARHQISAGIALIPPQLRPHALVLSALLLIVAVVLLWPSATDTSAKQDIAPLSVVNTNMGAADGNDEIIADDLAILDVGTESIEAVAEDTPSTVVLPEWSTYTVESGDTLSGIFDKLDLGAKTLRNLIAAGKTAAQFTQLRVGDTLQYKRGDDGQLEAIKRPLGTLDTLIAERHGDGWQVELQSLETIAQSVIKNGTVDGILSINLRDAGIPAGLANQFVNLFRYKVDYQREMRAGATFAVIYQDLEHDGKKVKSGPIEAAELTNAGKTLRVFRHEDSQGKSKYYTADGRSLEPSMLRTPVHYTRVSSPFNPNRLHPVLRYKRPHLGVDLASPTGTPIKAAADGYVKFVGWSGGYGRMVELKNMGAYSTRYGHMSRFVSTLKKGDRVHQGQVIGYVGQSGVATGPHLHFEIRINGKPYNPLTVKVPGAPPLSPNEIASFKKSIQPLMAALDAPDAEAAQRTLAEYDKANQPALVTASVERRDKESSPAL